MKKRGARPPSAPRSPLNLRMWPSRSGAPAGGDRPPTRSGCPGAGCKDNGEGPIAGVCTRAGARADSWDGARRAGTHAAGPSPGRGIRRRKLPRRFPTTTLSQTAGEGQHPGASRDGPHPAAEEWGKLPPRLPRRTSPAARGRLAHEPRGAPRPPRCDPTVRRDARELRSGWDLKGRGMPRPAESRPSGRRPDARRSTSRPPSLAGEGRELSSGVRAPAPRATARLRAGTGLLLK